MQSVLMLYCFICKAAPETTRSAHVVAIISALPSTQQDFTGAVLDVVSKALRYYDDVQGGGGGYTGLRRERHHPADGVRRHARVYHCGRWHCVTHLRSKSEEKKVRQTLRSMHSTVSV